MMTKMQAIFFSDYRLIENFLHDCSADVNKFQCGRIQTEDEEEVCYNFCYLKGNLSDSVTFSDMSMKAKRNRSNQIMFDGLHTEWFYEER